MARIPTFYPNFFFWFYSHIKLEFSQTNFIFMWLDPLVKIDVRYSLTLFGG